MLDIVNKIKEVRHRRMHQFAIKRSNYRKHSCLCGKKDEILWPDFVVSFIWKSWKPLNRKPEILLLACYDQRVSLLIVGKGSIGLEVTWETFLFTREHESGTFWCFEIGMLTAYEGHRLTFPWETCLHSCSGTRNMQTYE